MAGQVRIGTPDASLTSASGVVAVAELVGRLGVIEALDEAIGPIKQRDRGLSAGGLLVAMAQTQMLGGDFLSSLDRRRDDVVGESLSAVPTPASTTAAGLAARFTRRQLVGIEDGITEVTRRVMVLLPAKRRAVLHAGRSMTSLLKAASILPTLNATEPLRLLTRQAFGFHNPHALIGLAMLALGGLCPPLPGR